MVTTATAAPVRITVHGPHGSVDTCIWSGTTPAELLDDPHVRHGLRLPDGEHRALVHRSGARLDGATPVLAQQVADGDVLTVLVPSRAGGRTVPARGRARRPARTRRQVTRPTGPVVVALLLLATAALLAGPAGAALRTTAAAALLCAALAGAVAAPRDDWGDRCRVLAPVAAAVAVYAAVTGPGPGRIHLALAAAAVAAAVTASTARAGAGARASGHHEGRADGGAPSTPAVADHLLVVLLFSAAAAAVLGAGLLVGAPLHACGVVLAAAAALAPRLLPSAVVDVPDEALLELDRLAVTAWSAHERLPRRGWRRLRAHDVSDLVARARRLFGLTAVLCSVLATLGAVGAVAHLRTLPSVPTGPARYGPVAFAACVALTLALSARAVRDRAGRTAMLVGGAVTGLSVAVAVLAAADTGWRMAVLGGAVLVALGVVAAALALGRGWRSVRWARTGDVVEGVVVALVLPAAVVAAGGFDLVRQLTG